MGRAQAGEHRAGAAREALRQGQQERALAAEPLHQPAGRHAGFGGNVGEGELVRPCRVMARWAAANTSSSLTFSSAGLIQLTLG